MDEKKDNIIKSNNQRISKTSSNSKNYPSREVYQRAKRMEASHRMVSRSKSTDKDDPLYDLYKEIHSPSSKKSVAKESTKSIKEVKSNIPDKKSTTKTTKSTKVELPTKKTTSKTTKVEKVEPTTKKRTTKSTKEDKVELPSKKSVTKITNVSNKDQIDLPIKKKKEEEKVTLPRKKSDKTTKEEKVATVTKRKRKLNVKNLILLLILFASIISLIYSSVNTYMWYLDSKQTSELNDEIQDAVDIKEGDINSEIIEQETDVPKNNPYWDYIKMNLIEVDFADLKAINNETVGWIQVNGTNINYPFVQGKNNKYYLNHTFDKSHNAAGWVFMDYRNTKDGFNKNTILYAHGRKDKTMFGSLRNILKNDWYNNKDNHIIKLSTEYQNSLWQVFSVYRIPTTSDYIETDFKSDEDFKAFVDMLQARSAFKFDTTVSGSDKILTLSTCYNDNDKVVMHAKLIKYTNR